MLAAWACAALAVLSKGIVVGVLAGGALIVYTLIERDALTWRRLHVRLGLPLFLIIAAPWFVLVSARNPSFPGFFFVHEHFARFLTTVHQRVEPWWYFLPLLLLAVLPWIASAVRAVRSSTRDDARGSPAPALRRFKPLKFLWVFSAVTLAFFSASGSKLAPYILPMLPPLALLAGAQVHRSGRLCAPRGEDWRSPGGGRRCRTPHLQRAAQQLRAARGAHVGAAGIAAALAALLDELARAARFRCHGRPGHGASPPSSPGSASCAPTPSHRRSARRANW